MNGKKPLFDLGNGRCNPGFHSKPGGQQGSRRNFLRRHVTGDFGDLCDEDRQLNEQAVVNGDRILSA